jgi:O-antigen/teichoic acid export membrane protein
MIKTSMMPAYFLFPVLMAIMSWMYFRGEHKLTADAAMVLNLGCSALICFYITRKAKKAMNEKVESVEPTYSRNVWLSVSSILFLTTAMDLLLKQSDILMVGYFLNNTKAGFYAVASKLATLSSLGLAVADYIVMPRIAALFESRQYGKLQKMVRSASFQILSISLPVMLVLIIFGKVILGFFGLPYKDSYIPLVILLVGQLVNAATGMVGGLMMVTGHQRKFFIFYAGAILLQFVMNILLIRPLGINGAAISTTVAMVFLNMAAYFFVRKNLRIKASIF